MINKKGFKIKENIFSLVLTLIFISPAFFVKEGQRIVYIVLAGPIGWGIAKNLIFYLSNKERKKIHPLLSNSSLFIYLFIYLFISLLLDWNLYKENLLFFLLKILIGGILFFYGGFKQIQTKRAFLRGGQLNEKASVITGILAVIFAIFILFYRHLSTIFK